MLYRWYPSTDLKETSCWLCPVEGTRQWRRCSQKYSHLQALGFYLNFPPWWRLLVSNGCDRNGQAVDSCLLITSLRTMPSALTGIHQSAMTFCLN